MQQHFVLLVFFLITARVTALLGQCLLVCCQMVLIWILQQGTVNRQTDNGIDGSH